MIFSGARRFGLVVAGVWARRRWLIAALAASLVSVPLAGAAAPIARAPAVRGYQPGPLARPASLSGLSLPERLAIYILQGVSKSTLPGSAGVGRLLEQFGLGDKPESEVAGIRTELGEIQNRLDVLQTAVSQLRAEVAESEFSVLVGQTTELTAAIDRGMGDLAELANTPANDPAKKGFTEATLKFIDENMIEKPAQEELAQRITGVAGSDGLIRAFSKAARTRSPYWTRLTSAQVGEVFDYYQAEESRLLLLRVEYWHAHPLTYSASYIERSIQNVEQQVGTPEGVGQPAAVGTQETLLKRTPIEVIADTRTTLDWSILDFGEHLTYPQARDLAAQYGAWRLPTAREVQDFIARYPGWVAPNFQDWAEWLYNETGGLLPIKVDPASPTLRGGFTGSVWVYSPECSTAPDSCSYINYAGKEWKTEIGSSLPYNTFLVRDRSGRDGGPDFSYWW